MNQAPENYGTIKRTGEKALGIIGSIFNVIGIILSIIFITSLSGFEGSQMQMQMEEEIRNDPNLTNSGDVEMTIDMVNSFVQGFDVLGWIVVALLVVSTVFAILAITKLKSFEKANTAGIFFILAGIFAGILSLTSILFYIAAIMCFVRKPPLREDELMRRDNEPAPRNEAVTREDDTPYRPL
ncbi:DUF4064 domain-containing protein [Planococcus sp. CP5-4]|uniref:DUF4064 domain-containing protein n=1 Tax=unclassified Planococcus (in: firmicutes) TaxID=2662419 RepID=UPI001C21CF6D|nr:MULTISPECIES: DUF4064 domain-containing protein [unclassified Planococcus (in: firmicutes)]MBU9672314.1 DUF4064 domain-containing protein [Planococcus sp. CP5-4_YE]MBV0909365.1 DUF4064 domain-containing protein [Planococcus sp. CP5-4_UN]MBW6064094.1 DUF4064 domain-containing protein [Planococcus sp. CP5-4]